MSAALSDLASVVATVGGLVGVEALTVSVRMDDIKVGHHRHQPVVEVSVHAAGYADAVRVAEAWGLPEGEDRYASSEVCGPLRWRTWAGWATAVTRSVPVSVTVTAAEAATAEAVA